MSNENESRIVLGERLFFDLMFKTVEFLTLELGDRPMKTYSGVELIGIFASYCKYPEVMGRLRMDLIIGMNDSMVNDPVYSGVQPEDIHLMSRMMAENIVARGQVIGELMGDHDRSEGPI